MKTLVVVLVVLCGLQLAAQDMKPPDAPTDQVWASGRR